MKKIIQLTLMCAVYLSKMAVASPTLLPQQQMQLLNKLTGNWSLVIDSSNDHGKTWQRSPAQLVSIEYRHNQLVLEETPSEQNEAPFKMLTLLSYDQYRQVFRKAAIDNVWGIMDLYQGSIVNNQLILDNLTARTFFPIGQDKWRGFRLTMDLTVVNKEGLDIRYMNIDKTDDDGKSWQPAFKATYTKILE